MIIVNENSGPYTRGKCFVKSHPLIRSLIEVRPTLLVYPPTFVFVSFYWLSCQNTEILSVCPLSKQNHLIILNIWQHQFPNRFNRMYTINFPSLATRWSDIFNVHPMLPLLNCPRTSCIFPHSSSMKQAKLGRSWYFFITKTRYCECDPFCFQIGWVMGYQDVM